MNKPAAETFFGPEAAAKYDQQWAKLSPLRDTMHLLMVAAFSELPTDARVLCVGAGTGAEIFFLARKFPEWNFTAVEPSLPMLDVFRRGAEEHGITPRCVFHHGYLESVPTSNSFDAATALLVSQFIVDREERIRFFRAIAERLKPTGILVSSDLASDTHSADYERLLEIWLRLMNGADVPSEVVERIRVAYERDVAVLPPQEIRNIIAAGGFQSPLLCFQAGLIHGWISSRD